MSNLLSGGEPNLVSTIIILYYMHSCWCLNFITDTKHPCAQMFLVLKANYHPPGVIKAGLQYDAGHCVASRHASLKRGGNATRRLNRTKFYSCAANVAFLLPAKRG